MTIEQLRKVHQAQPFRAFRMKLADGNELNVSHPELLSYSASGRTVIVVTADDSFEVVDLLLVASIEVGDGQTTRRRKRK